MDESPVTSHVDLLGVGPHELVSVVGAGGKSTLVLALGAELAARHRPVVVTTTTRMGVDQVGNSVCRVADPPSVDRALAQVGPLFVIGLETNGKVAGYEPDVIDRIYRETSAHHVLVEADGARRRSIKAPASHEPVIPSASTLVVVAAGLDAIGAPIAGVAHRPDLVAELLQCEPTDVLTPGGMAAVLSHHKGGLKDIPTEARVVVALTKATSDSAEAAEQIGRLLRVHTRIDSVAMIPEITSG